MAHPDTIPTTNPQIAKAVSLLAEAILAQRAAHVAGDELEVRVNGWVAMLACCRAQMALTGRLELPS